MIHENCIAKYELLCLELLDKDSKEKWGLNIFTCQREVPDYRDLSDPKLLLRPVALTLPPGYING